MYPWILSPVQRTLPKIQRIVERFEIGKVDKAGVITQAEQDKADREAVAREVPTKTKGEIIVEEAMGKPLQKEGQSHENPTVAKTEKKPSVRAKLRDQRYGY